MSEELTDDTQNHSISSRGAIDSAQLAVKYSNQIDPGCTCGARDHKNLMCRYDSCGGSVNWPESARVGPRVGLAASLL